MFTDYTEYCFAPYRGAYKDDLICTLVSADLDELPDEASAPFQSSPEYVKRGACLIIQYDLNIFYEG